MAKKYYWPTLWDTLGITLSNGFIAPQEIYAKMLADGVKIAMSEYSLNDSSITLYGQVPNIKFNDDSSMINHPAIIEIDGSCLKSEFLEEKDSKEKIYSYSQPIFFSADCIKVFFYTEEAKKMTENRVSNGLTIKNVEDYSNKFSVKARPSKSTILPDDNALFNGNQSFREYDPLHMMKRIRLIDAIKGARAGLIAGLYAQKTNDERDIYGLIQEIKNKYAGAKSDFLVNQSRNASYIMDAKQISQNGKDLQVLFSRLKREVETWQFGQATGKILLERKMKIVLAPYYPDKLDSHYKKYLKTCYKYETEISLKEEAVAYFIANPVKWIISNDLIETPHFWDLLSPICRKSKEQQAEAILNGEPIFIVYKLSKMIDLISAPIGNKAIDHQQVHLLLDNLQNYVSNYFIKDKQTLINGNFSSLFHVNPEINYNHVDYIMSDWLQREKQQSYRLWQVVVNLLIEEASKVTKLAIKNNGWQYDKRIDYIKKVIDQVGPSEGNQRLIADLNIVLKALEQNFEGNARIEDIQSSIVGNLYAFLFKHSSLEDVNNYLDKKQVPDTYFAWCFWGAFYGYSSLPAKLYNPIVNCWNKGNVELDKEFNQLVERIDNKQLK